MNQNHKLQLMQKFPKGITSDFKEIMSLKLIFHFK